MIKHFNESLLSQELILQKELETVFEFSYDPIDVIEGDGFVLRVNPACSRFYEKLTKN
jgi:hypothetical protein